MSELFIDLYLDEDVAVLIAALLRSRGYRVVTTVEAGQRGRSDEEQLAFATTNQMAIVTHNRVDFERLAAAYAEAGRHHPGIVIAVRRLPHEIARRLLAILDDVPAEEMVDQVRYI
jgi:predicted nuclease of predicted toxin-antitoxin system